MPYPDWGDLAAGGGDLVDDEQRVDDRDGQCRDLLPQHGEHGDHDGADEQDPPIAMWHERHRHRDTEGTDACKRQEHADDRKERADDGHQIAVGHLMVADLQMLLAERVRELVHRFLHIHCGRASRRSPAGCSVRIGVRRAASATRIAAVVVPTVRWHTQAAALGGTASPVPAAGPASAGHTAAGRSTAARHCSRLDSYSVLTCSDCDGSHFNMRPIIPEEITTAWKRPPYNLWR